MYARHPPIQKITIPRLFVDEMMDSPIATTVLPIVQVHLINKVAFLGFSCFLPKICMANTGTLLGVCESAMGCKLRKEICQKGESVFNIKSIRTSPDVPS